MKIWKNKNTFQVERKICVTTPGNNLAISYKDENWHGL